MWFCFKIRLGRQLKANQRAGSTEKSRMILNKLINYELLSTVIPFVISTNSYNTRE